MRAPPARSKSWSTRPELTRRLPPGRVRVAGRRGTVDIPLTERTDVLIIGAGPTGLVLALWLTRLGIRVRVVDKTTEPGTTSRALAVQGRTLELYRQVGLADAVLTEERIKQLTPEK